MSEDTSEFPAVEEEYIPPFQQTRGGDGKIIFLVDAAPTPMDAHEAEMVFESEASAEEKRGRARKIFAKNLLKNYGKLSSGQKTILDLANLEISEEEFVKRLNSAGAGLATKEAAVQLFCDNTNNRNHSLVESGKRQPPVDELSGDKIILELREHQERKKFANPVFAIQPGNAKPIKIAA